MEVDRNTFPESGQTDNFVEPTSGQSRTEQPTVEAADRRAQHAAPADFPVHSADLPDQGNFLLDKPVNPCLRPNAPDPVESGLKKIWYVRYPKAGEDGPIKGKRIAKMLKDKKIFAGCYVWREDWEDWIRAELIFRELMPEQAAMPDNRLFTDANASIPKSYQMKAQAQANAKKRRLTLGVVAIVIGMVTIGLLVWLLTTMW